LISVSTVLSLAFTARYLVIAGVVVLDGEVRMHSAVLRVGRFRSNGSAIIGLIFVHLLLVLFYV
jgi:hypothetical protein